nr:integrase, catalytic region, zinc finger, CCHC-type, peptidase aspartic, catalytic [Tanacetum cinerariifolium]
MVVDPVVNAGANQTRIIKCYNCNGEGQITKQYTTKKRVKDSEWFKDKMLLAQVQEAGVVLNREQHDFLADSLEETNDCEDLQLQATTNFKADHIDAYDSDCDDEATTNAIFMVNLSLVGSINDDTIKPRYDSDIPSERRTTLSPHQIGSWEQSNIKGAFKKDVISFSENLKETFKLFEKGFIAEVKEMKDTFEQMEDEIIEIVLRYLDLGCFKHMTGHRDKLIKFVSKFIGTVRFGNDHFAAIMGYGYLQIGKFLFHMFTMLKDLVIIYSPLGNCDSDIEIAFRKHTCFVHNLEGDDLLLDLVVLIFIQSQWQI